jgi:hypothetical protein
MRVRRKQSRVCRADGFRLLREPQNKPRLSGRRLGDLRYLNDVEVKVADPLDDVVSDGDRVGGPVSVSRPNEKIGVTRPIGPCVKATLRPPRRPLIRG